MFSVLVIRLRSLSLLFVSGIFFFNDTATTEIYTLSLHDALPIFALRTLRRDCLRLSRLQRLHHRLERADQIEDRKSTRLNSSHVKISYAVFCLKKKKKKKLEQNSKKKNKKNYER